MGEFCLDHKCLKEKVNALGNNRRFWHRIFDSKWFFWAATGLVAAFIAFNVWVTTEIFAQKSRADEGKAADKSISQSITEVKEELKDAKNKLAEESKRREEQRDKDQKELMRVLLDIQKQIKK